MCQLDEKQPTVLLCLGRVCFHENSGFFSTVEFIQNNV